ncbi:Uncharacterised protein [uncultured archaeon]|nr:Uncharacterised protein [uncultured archaeon]
MRNPITEKIHLDADMHAVHARLAHSHSNLVSDVEREIKQLSPAQLREVSNFVQKLENREAMEQFTRFAKSHIRKVKKHKYIQNTEDGIGECLICASDDINDGNHIQ